MATLYYIFFMMIGFGFCGEDKYFRDPHIKWVKCKASDVYHHPKNLNSEWLAEHDKKGWYYVMGNKWHIISMTNSLTGKAPENRTEIKNACFTNQHTAIGFKITGYGNKADYTCDNSMDKHIRECHPNSGSTNEVWATMRGTTEATVVWTDNVKYTLGYRCSAMYKVWSLRSIENSDVEPEVKTKVMAMIKKDGFNPDNAVTIPREGCPVIK